MRECRHPEASAIDEKQQTGARVIPAAEGAAHAPFWIQACRDEIEQINAANEYDNGS